MGTGAELGVSPETVVIRWFDAFNDRNLEGMLACLGEQVDFHPLRLSGCASAYRGHDGIRAWLIQLGRRGDKHRIVISETRRIRHGQVFASGSVTLPDLSAVGSFCALHTFGDGRIVAAHHYLSDPDMIERLGLLQ